MSQLGSDAPLELSDGFHAMSNASLDSPWHKAEFVKAEMRRLRAPDWARALGTGSAPHAHAHTLLDVMRCAARTEAHAHHTGAAESWEFQLSSPFVLSDACDYGTRTTTLVGICRSDAHVHSYLAERSYDTDRFRRWMTRPSDQDVSASQVFTELTFAF